MNAQNISPGNGGHLDSNEAAQILSRIGEQPSLAAQRDVRLWSVTAAGIGLLMGGFLALSSLSPLVTFGYAILLLAFVAVQRRFATVTPRGVSRIFTAGVLCSSVMVALVILVLGIANGGLDQSPVWQCILGGLVVAAPSFTASALISRKGV